MTPDAISKTEIGTVLVLTWLVYRVLAKVASVRAAKNALQDLPGRTISWLRPSQGASVMLGGIYPPKGWTGRWYAKFDNYRQFGSTCFGTVTFGDSSPTYWVADAEAWQTICHELVTYRKDVESYKIFNFFGDNLISTEGDVWKRHKAVARSAFNEENIALAWHETLRASDEYFKSVSKDLNSAGEVTVNVLKDLTQLTLFIISSSAFGQPVAWKTDDQEKPPPGYRFTFKQSLINAGHYLLLRVLIPDVAYKLPIINNSLKDLADTFKEMRQYMADVIVDARGRLLKEDPGFQDAALIRNLVRANSAEAKDKQRLSDEELLSNVFIFYLAGHETTASALSFALLHLALYPEVQNKIYEETLQIWADEESVADPGNAPYKETLNRMKYTTAFLHESLRFFPPVLRLEKLVSHDAVLKYRKFDPQTGVETSQATTAVKAGGWVILDIHSLHFNPLHWGQDVDEFKPERFIDTDTYRWPRDAFVAFSTGARSCIGQRFAITESVAVLSALIRRFEILPPVELEGKSFSERQAGLLKWKPGLTTIPLAPYVRLRRRY